MKKIILIHLVLALFNFSFGQSKLGENSNIVLSVEMPDNQEFLNSRQLNKIKSKVIQIATSNGVSAEGYNSNFIIYPTFEVYDEKAVKGLRDLVSISADFNLFIKSNSTGGNIFASVSHRVYGSGNNRAVAIDKAIQQINRNSPDIQEFVKTAKARIIEFYNNKCEDIMRKADSHIAVDSYPAAISELLAIPEDASDCHRDANNKLNSVYVDYQNIVCGKIINYAKAEAAKGNNIAALDVLKYIDPRSKCASDGQTLISEISSSLDVEEQRDWEMERIKYDDVVELEKLRIQAMTQIAAAYHNRPTDNNLFNLIIK